MPSKYVLATQRFLKNNDYPFAKVVGEVVSGDEVIVVVDTSVVPGRRKLGTFVYDKDGTMLEYNLSP